jgi:glucose-6-phosphate 1-dehydrogenase
MENPFRSGLRSREIDPCVVVIFGVTGDLTHRKLVPALYNLSLDGLLPATFGLVGFARRPVTDEAFREDLKGTTEKFSRRKPLDPAVWAEFASRAVYVQSAFDDKAGYQKLKQTLEGYDKSSGQKCKRLFYLATSPDFFEVIARELKGAGLLDPEGGEERARVIVEKPFGHDLASARELNSALSECMRENQIYRIDHFLGKETVQNLLVFRFANGIFEPIWNHKYISHVELSFCESIGIENRAGYFDKAGIMRDIIQNHLFQVLCLVALEPPVAFEANSLRDEKVKVLRCIHRYTPQDVLSKVVRARYQSGTVGGKEVPGYLGEPGVDPKSTTESYVAMEFAIDNWRWAGVPFFVRAGKRLPKRVTDISIYFRHVPYRLFQEEGMSQVTPNVLSFEIQPDEGISLKISAKPPGPRVRVQAVNMNFSYGSSFGVDPPEAYERLILDCMRGDATLFTRSDEIEQAWDILMPVLNAWAQPESKAPPIYGYEAGTWGPSAADELMTKRVKSTWRRL